MPHWITTRFSIDLSHPVVMGIVNVTPDSFSDGSNFLDSSSALKHCEKLLKEGAGILDVGGESSRPGAMKISWQEEWGRIDSILKVAVGFGVPISVDTYKPEIMRRALDLGVDIINDIYALQEKGAEDVLLKHPNCGICLMHMQGNPMTMQNQPIYQNVINEVKDFFRQKCHSLLNKGVDPKRICIDPGIGFGKSLDHNFELLKNQRELIDLGYPILVGWSRKSSLGTLVDKPVEQRLAASLSAALGAVKEGAKIIRVHDVAETVDAIKVWRRVGWV